MEVGDAPRFGEVLVFPDAPVTSTACGEPMALPLADRHARFEGRAEGEGPWGRAVSA